MDLKDLTAVDAAGRYLLRLMKAKSVTLAGGGIGIRALLDDEQSPVVSGGLLSPAQAVVSLGDNPS